MRVIPVPLNQDNYGYLVVDEHTNKSLIVDVSGQPDQIHATAQRHHVAPELVLTTHKHWDHAGGNNRMKELYSGIEILGSRIDNVEGCTRFVDDSESFTFGELHIRCLHTPGHTLGHISYFIESHDERVLFTGDCLFVGGCGKFFEGTAHDMYMSLYERISALPPDTKIFCGHEYTLSNYKFALSIEPHNQDLILANKIAKTKRDEGDYTVPSTIAHELKTNPFLRVHEESVASHYSQCDTPIEVLGALREAKNNF